MSSIVFALNVDKDINICPVLFPVLPAEKETVHKDEVGFNSTAAPVQGIASLFSVR